MVIPTEKTWHYIVGADAHIGPPPGRLQHGGMKTVQNPVRRTDGTDGGTGNPSPTMGKPTG